MSDYSEYEVVKTTPAASGFDSDQIEQLLKPINEKRTIVANKHRHIPQQEVRAHLIRIFGFGSFDEEIISTELVFEQNTYDKDEKIYKPDRYDVSYRATVGLTIRNRQGDEVCRYEEVATGVAQNQKRGEAHDLALKSAVSGALKRCAINLGDQFGLSLYNGGQMHEIVKGILVGKREEDKKDIQEGVSRANSLGLIEDSGAIEEGDDAGEIVGSGKGPSAQNLDRSKPKKIIYTPEQMDEALAIIDDVDGFMDEFGLQRWYESNKALADVPVGKRTIRMEVTRRIGELRE